jgi:3-dehydroquinate synthetase
MVPSVLVKDSPLVTVQEMETAKAEAEALRSALVWEKVKVQQLESALQTVTVKEKVPMSETAKESALSKGWGWVLGSAEQSPPQLQQEQHKPE